MKTSTRDIDFTLLPENKLFMGVCIAEGENDDGRKIMVTSTGQGLHVRVGEDQVQISIEQLVAQSIAATDELRATHSLIGELEAKGITESDMDELVHEIGSKEDSDVNNQGLPAQVLHILRQCGVEEGSRLIRATWEEA